MKKLWKWLCVLFLLPCLLGNKNKDELKSISKPYLGSYECEKLIVFGKDRTDDFTYLQAEVTEDKILWKAKHKTGKKYRSEIEYETDGNGKVTLKKDGMPTKNVTVKIDKGKITVLFQLDEQIVYLIMKRP